MISRLTKACEIKLCHWNLISNFFFTIDIKLLLNKRNPQLKIKAIDSQHRNDRDEPISHRKLEEKSENCSKHCSDRDNWLVY